MLMFNGLARERGCVFRILLLPLLFCFVTAHGSAASAASLIVKIRQLNPAGDIQQVTCTAFQKYVAPVSIVTGQGKAETVTVNILYSPDSLLFEFQVPKGYFYARDSRPGDPRAMYETLWHASVAKDKPSVNDVTLFLPLAPRGESDPLRSTVERPVADLEITTEVAP